MSESVVNPDIKQTISVDDLSKKIQETTNELDQLKNGLNVYSIEEQDRRLAEIEDSILDCTQDLQHLETETLSNTEKDELNRLKTKINTLKSSKEQLKQQIERQTRAEIETLSQEVAQSQSQESSEKSKEKKETGKKILRVVGGVGLVAGTVALFKKLFGKKDKEKSKGSESNEKKKFRDRPIGKVLKWTGIGTAIYYIAHGIKTGKWGLKDFFNWDSDAPTNSAQEVYDNYSELAQEDPEKYAEYEKIGENINLMYDQIWDTERNYFGDNSQVVMGSIGNDVEEKKLQKNEKFEHIDTKGMVVYSLDNFYSDVGQLLSYGGVEKYIRSKTISEYKSKIKSFGAEWFDKAMVPFLSGFANFASFGIVSKDTAQQKMDKYFKGISENEGDCLAQLDLFFRQYTKVLTYMADKKNAIALQEARKIISVQGYNGKSRPTNVSDQNDMLYEAINDTDWLEKKLKGTPYSTFMSSNILGASRILKNEGLDGSKMTEELEEIISGVDKQTEKIIGGFDDNALKKAESKLNNGKSLDANDKNGLNKIVKNIVDDMGDETKPGWIYNTFDYFFEAFDLGNANKKMILEESGLSQCFNDIVSAIQNLQSEVSSNPTKENIELLKNLVGQYTSLKKELAVAIYAINEAKESKDGLDKLLSFGKLIGGFFAHFAGSMKNLFHLRANIGDFINIFAGLTVTGGIVEIAGRIGGKPWAIKLGKYTKKAGLLPCALVEMGLGRTRLGWAVKHRINDIAKTNPTKAENLMKKKILDGVLSPKQVGKILEKNPKIKNSLCIYTSESDEKMFKAVVDNIFGDTYKTQANLFVKYYNKIDTNCLIDCTNDNSIRGLKNGMFKMNVHEGVFQSLDKFDKEFEKLGGNTVQKTYFEVMLKKVNEGADIDLLTDLMKNEEFRKMINGDNFKLLKKLKISELRELKQSGKLDDFTSGKIKANEMVSSLKRFSKKATSTVGETVENMSEARRMFNECINDAIKVIEHSGNPESVMVKEITEKLKNLKEDSTLLDEQMECFTKFIKRGFEAVYIPDLKKLLEIKDIYKGEAIGEKFQKLLSDGNIDAFRGFLGNKNNREIQKAIKNAGVKSDELLTCLKKVTKGMSGNEVKTFVQGFATVFSKILKQVSKVL